MVPIFDFFNVYILLAGAIGLLWYYSKSTYSFWQKLNVKFLKPIPVFGNTASFVLHQKSMHETIEVLYKSFFNDPYGGFYEFRDPLLLVKDPELVSSILIKDFKNFSSRRLSLFFNPDKKINPLSVNLLTTNGKRWKALRQKMSPLFSTSKVRQMYDQMFYCVNLLTEYLDKRMDSSGSIDVAVKQLFDQLTMDIIGTCAFGIECNALESNGKFIEMCKEPFKVRSVNIIRLIVSVFSERLVALLNFRDQAKEVSDFFMSLALDTVKYRRQNGATRNDMLQLLMTLQNSHIDPEFAVQNDVKVLENGK